MSLRRYAPRLAWMKLALFAFCSLSAAQSLAQEPVPTTGATPAPMPTEAPTVAEPNAEPAPVAAAAPTAAPAAVAAVPGDDAGFYGSAAADPGETTATYPKFELSGFGDFTFVKNLSSSSSPLRQVVQPYSSFSVGNLNVYFNAALAEKWHFLAEVRFLYLPQGVRNYPSAAGQSVAPYDASALDYANDNRPLSWGGVRIERAQVDYEAHPLLTLRFGQFLTPVGIWNIDHGSPVVIGVYRPYIVGQGLFPESQTGIEAFGEWSGATNALGYALTVSNGRGPSDTYTDLDANKALGARTYWTNTALGTLTLGASAYKGTYASRNLQYGYTTPPPGQSPALKDLSPLTVRYREQSIGADIRWQYGALLLQAEAMQHEIVYDAGLHSPATPTSVYAGYRERGYYLLAGYRFPWFGVMPYALGGGYDFGSQPFVAPAIYGNVGLNIRPEPNVVIKLEAGLAKLGSDSSAEPYRGNLRRVLTQLAVAF